MTFPNCLALPNEEFRDVPKFKGFIAASNMGRIYSHPRSVVKFSILVGKVVTQKYEGRFLSLYTDKDKYCKVRFGIDKKKFSERVARLVLMAFDREPTEDEFACHNDSDPQNNWIENLRWDTQTGNMKDRLDRVLYKRGEDHHAATISTELVDRLQAGLITPNEAAKEYGYRYQHLWRIANGQSWKHRWLQNNNIRVCPNKIIVDHV